MSSTSQTLQPEDLLEHLEWLHRLARALTHGDATEAEDLAEDAVEAALADPPRLTGPVRPWLGGVLRNLAHMRGRTSARRRRREAAVVDVDAVEPSAADLTERVEAQRRVAGLVLALDEPFRSTLLLRYYEDLTAADISRRLGVPAGTVRWRIKHALDELRPAMDRAYGRRERWHALLLPLPAPRLLARKSSRPEPEAVAPAAATGTIRWSIGSQLVIAFVCLLLLALGTAGLVWARRHRGRETTLAEAAAHQRQHAAWRLGANGMRLAPAEGEPSGAPPGVLRIEGQVIDADENPVGGATVGIDADPPRTVITRLDGGFVFEGLMPRTYAVEATLGSLYAGAAETFLSPKSEPIILRAGQGLRTRIVVRTANGGHPISGAQVTVREILSWGGRTGPDGALTLEGVGWGTPQLLVEAAGYAPFHRKMVPDRVDGWQIQLEPGTPVEGRVVDAHGSPVVGALVWAAPTSEMRVEDDPRRDAVTTDDAGRWKIAALAAGTYRFTASHPGHAQSGTAPMAVDGGRPTTPITIRLEEGGTITGEVRSPDGTLLASAQVRAAEKIPWGSRWPRGAFTDANGQFRLEGLPRRPIDLFALNADGSSPTATLDLRTGAPDQHVVLVMSNDKMIAGTVVDGAGQPVGEAQVMVDPAPNSPGWPPREEQLRLDRRFVTDGGGHFHFAGLPAGDYRLRAAPTTGLDLMSPAEGVLAKPGEANVRIVVPRRGSVKGSVVYEEGGAPPRFGVTVGMVSREFIGTDGTFTLEVPAGHADLILRGITFLNRRLGAVDVAEGKTTDLGVIKVKDGRDLGGRVLRTDGTPVAGAEVRIVPGGVNLAGDGRKVMVDEKAPGISTHSGDDGRYSIRLADTEFLVVADIPGVGRSTVVQVPRGPLSRDIDLVIGATSTLNGLVSRDGQPIPYMQVTASPRDIPRAQFAVISGPDGRYQFDVLAPGSYRVRIEDTADAVSAPRHILRKSVSVEEGQPAQLDIDLVMGPYTLTVDVKTERGDAIPSAKVLAMSGDRGDLSSLMQLFEHFDKGPDDSASLHTAWAQAGLQSLSIADLLPGTYTICTTPSWDPRPQDGPRDQMRCVVRQVASSSHVSLTVPAGWVVRP